MYLYVFSILNDFINLTIWGPWDRETSSMRFSLTMASLNLIIKPFLTPAMLELVKRNGAGATAAYAVAGTARGYNPIGATNAPGGAGAYASGPYSKEPTYGGHSGADLNSI